MLKNRVVQLALGIVCCGIFFLILGVVLFFIGYYQVIDKTNLMQAYTKVILTVIGITSMGLAGLFIVLPCPYLIYQYIKFRKQEAE